MRIQEVYPKLYNVKLIIEDKKKYSQIIATSLGNDGVHITYRPCDGIAYVGMPYYLKYENLENWTPEQIAEEYLKYEQKCREELDSKKCKTCGHIKRDLIW